MIYKPRLSANTVWSTKRRSQRAANVTETAKARWSFRFAVTWIGDQAMADLGISFSRLTNGNIRHIYSVTSRPAFIPGPRPHGRTSQFVSMTLENRYPPKFYDYYPAYQIGLPRAPAFDRLTAPEVHELVKRLRQPITCQIQRARKLEPSGSEEIPRTKGTGQSKAVRWKTPTAMTQKLRTAEETPETKAAGKTTASMTNKRSKAIDSKPETEVKAQDEREQPASKPSGEAEHGQTTEVTEHRQTAKVTEHGQTTEVTEHGQTTEVTEHGQTTEVTEHGQTTEVTEQGQTAEVTEHGQTTEVKIRSKAKSDLNFKKDKKGQRTTFKLPLIYLGPHKQSKRPRKTRKDKPENRYSLPPIAFLH